MGEKLSCVSSYFLECQVVMQKKDEEGVVLCESLYRLVIWFIFMVSGGGIREVGVWYSYLESQLFILGLRSFFVGKVIDLVSVCIRSRLQRIWQCVCYNFVESGRILFLILFFQFGQEVQ